MPLPVKHLSSSKVSCYAQCPRMFWYRYILKVGGPDSPPLVLGSAFHSALENYFLEPSVGLVEQWRHAWRAEVASRQSVAWGDKSEDAVKAVGDRMFSSKVVQETVRGLSPLRTAGGEPYVEHFVRADVGLPVPLVGYVDIITDDGVPGDFKTAKRRWPAGREDSQFQPLYYLHALKQEGFECPGNRFRYYVFTKQKPGVQVIERVYPQAQIEWGLEALRSMWRGLLVGAYPPCSPMAWWCNPKWCDYYERCGRVPAVAPDVPF